MQDLILRKMFYILLELIKKTVEAQNDITLEEIIEKLNLPIKKSRLLEVLI